MPKGDSLCPLGFHPQFRRPNYCKRCFREYSEHKQVGSNTSINSVGLDRDSYGSRDSLSPRTEDEKTSDEDEIRSSRRIRPMSWSAQDLRKAVNDAKSHVKLTPTEDSGKRFFSYGRNRSFTQDLGTLNKSEPEETTKKYSKEAEDKRGSSFSSYLASKKPSPRYSSSSATTDANDETSSKYPADGRPPKAPLKLKTDSDTDNSVTVETITLRRPKKSIQSLREVKSEDADASYVIQLKPKKKEDTEPKKDYKAENEKLNSEIEKLKNQLKTQEEKIEKLDAENKELTKKPKLEFKNAEVIKLNKKVDELSEEIRQKTREISGLRRDKERRTVSLEAEKALEDLKQKLQSSERLCRELSEENDDYKKEIKTLEEEIEELQDSFREDQADEYRDLKRELEHRAKDCRVLQFKLKKAERRTEQLERDKDEVESKLKELQVGETDVERAERIQLLEKELSLAKEVSMKMHDEMEKMQSQLEVAESDKQKLSEKVQDTPVKSVFTKRSQMLGRQGSQENTEQLLKDALEREQDIKEQLKFAEEETKNLRKKLSRIEDENETLQLQLNKMSTKVKRHRSMERTGSSERSNSVERGSLSRQGSTEKPIPEDPKDDMDPTDLKIQLELNEQEAVILRRKVESLETENMRLQKEIKEYFSSDVKKTDNDTKKDGSYLNKTVRNLEKEISEQKRRISELEKEKETLSNDLSTAKKRKITRNRSIEHTESEDKKKIEALEKEIDSFRKKCIELESKNEKTADELNQFKIKSSYKKPSSFQENMHIEKQVLEEKASRLQKRIEEIYKPAGSNEIKIKELEDRIEEMSTELSRHKKDNEEMKSSSAYKNRIPRIPKDITPKATLIKWVNELENECGLLLTSLKETEKRLETAKSGGSKDVQDKLEKEKERNEELTRQLTEEREKAVKGAKNNVNDLNNADDRIRLEELQKQISDGTLINFEQLREAQIEKHRLQKELTESQQVANSCEKRLKEAEETLKISEKAERNLRNLLEKAEKRIDEEKNSQYSLEEKQKELNDTWTKERDDLKRAALASKRAKEGCEKEVKEAQKRVRDTEERLVSEKRITAEVEGKWKADKEKFKQLQTDKEILSSDLNESRETVLAMEKEKDRLIKKHSKDLESQKKENEDLKIRMTTLETELKTEKKKRERLEKDSSIGLRGKSSEILEAREKIQKMETEKSILESQMESLKMDFEYQLNDLTRQMRDKTNEASDLRMRCDELIADLDNQKVYTNQDQSFIELKKDYDTIEGELKALRETYNLHKDNWIKEKLNMQVQMFDMEKKCSNGDNGEKLSYSEKQKLMSIIEDKTQQIETLKVEMDTIMDQLSYYRKEADEQRKKIEDLEKLQEFSDKRQSSAAVDTKSYESTIRDLKSRLTALEKLHKSEATKTKMRYDTKVKALTEEVAAVTNHMKKYRRERDTYKDMMDVAQKTIAELRGNPVPYKPSRADTANEASAHLSEIQDLQGQITDLEDKLADARLTNTKLSNELVDQKTSFEIQLCDMQTKLNEFEEDRLLSGSGRRVPGLRTRLELNWQREREEQQRLIQETTTLAKDLRQTLYEVERERDMDRLEAKRKIEQLKKTVSLEHSDTKGKVQELQRDLMELREAHAKLRQINEKLRREKDRTEVEREAMRDKFLGSSREHLNQQSKMEKLIEQMYKVKDLSPLVLGETIDGKDSSLKSLTTDNNPRTREEYVNSLRRLLRSIEDLKVLMGLGEERERARRTPSFKKAMSVESDDSGPRSSRSLRPPPRSHNAQLYRKAQSLDHHLADEKNKIWQSDVGSTSSIESAKTDDLKRHRSEYDSLDRMSTGSQTSDLDSSGTAKKGLIGMLSKFGKAKSIEDNRTASTPGLSGSGNRISEDSSVSGKIKTLFKKPSRPSSTDREIKQSSSKRLPVHLEETSSIGSDLSVQSEIVSPSFGLQTHTLNARKMMDRSASFETNV